MYKVKNVCCECEYEWIDNPGAYGEHFKDGCPKCKSLYWVSRKV